jgi:hypothetical protein
MRSGWLGTALFLTTLQAMLGQSEPSMPAWLANYPGVTAQTTKAKSLVESTYTAPAKPDAVSDHYRKLFETQNLPFVPNFDGMGAVVRAAAPECDLMISLRAQGAGTSVRVDCTGNGTSAGTWSALPDSTSTSNSRTPARPFARPLPRPVSGQPPRPPQLSESEIMERHQQLVKELNIHPVRQDAPAPPLVWPEWLVHVNGRKVAFRAGVDRAGHDYLRGTYVTSTPMTAIHEFYEDLLKANGYPVHSGELSTGHTISGIVQNASGHAEGHNYPNGHPGPYTEVYVGYHRSNLNDPITVELKFTTYAYQAPPPFGQ